MVIMKTQNALHFWFSFSLLQKASPKQFPLESEVLEYFSEKSIEHFFKHLSMSKYIFIQISVGFFFISRVLF